MEACRASVMNGGMQAHSIADST